MKRLSAMLFYTCSNGPTDLAGSTRVGNPGNALTQVTGVIYGLNGLPQPQARVELSRSSVLGADTQAMATQSDSLGRYQLDVSAAGMYNLTAIYDKDSTKAFQQDIPLGSLPFLERRDTLKPMGSISLHVERISKIGTYLYITGVDSSIKILDTGRILIDGVPAGRVDLWNTRLLGSGDLEIDGYLYRIFVAPHCTTSFPLEEAMAAKQNIPGIALYGPVDTIEFSEFDGEVVRDTSVNIRLFGIIKSATPCESDSFIVTVTGVPDIYRSYSLTDGIVKIAGSMPCNKYFVTNDTTLGGAMIGGSIVFTNVDTSSLISGYIPPGSYLAAVNNYHISYFAISGKFSVVFSKY